VRAAPPAECAAAACASAAAAEAAVPRGARSGGGASMLKTRRFRLLLVERRLGDWEAPPCVRGGVAAAAGDAGTNRPPSIRIGSGVRRFGGRHMPAASPPLLPAAGAMAWRAAG